MSVETQESEIVERFNENFSHVSRTDNHTLFEDRIDGKSWVSDAKVMLLTPEVTNYDGMEFSEYVNADYIGTESVGDENGTTRSYGFNSGEITGWIDVDFVRNLANNVFDVEYSEIKNWATIDPNNHEWQKNRGVEDTSLVLFDVPDSQYRVVVAPVTGEPQ